MSEDPPLTKSQFAHRWSHKFNRLDRMLAKYEVASRETYVNCAFTSVHGTLAHYDMEEERTDLQARDETTERHYDAWCSERTYDELGGGEGELETARGAFAVIKALVKEGYHLLRG